MLIFRIIPIPTILKILKYSYYFFYSYRFIIKIIKIKVSSLVQNVSSILISKYLISLYLICKLKMVRILLGLIVRMIYSST